MATEKQIAANRRNASKSTGPRTQEGKAAVSMNAVKHGLLARGSLLPDEDAVEHSALTDRVTQALQPVGDWEGILVDRVVQGLWRLGRLSRVEAGLFTAALLDEVVAARRTEVSKYESYPLRELMDVDDRCVVTDEAAHAAAMAKLNEAHAARAGTLPGLGQAFVAREATLATLSRYEATIERGIFKALHELQRCQAARQGQEVPPPIAADVDISLSMGAAGVEAKQSQSGAGGGPVPPERTEAGSDCVERIPRRGC